jgi:hypothetical protein
MTPDELLLRRDPEAAACFGFLTGQNVDGLLSCYGSSPPGLSGGDPGDVAPTGHSRDAARGDAGAAFRRGTAPAAPSVFTTEEELMYRAYCEADGVEFAHADPGPEPRESAPPPAADRYCEPCGQYGPPCTHCQADDATAFEETYRAYAAVDGGPDPDSEQEPEERETIETTQEKLDLLLAQARYAPGDDVTALQWEYWSRWL